MLRGGGPNNRDAVHHASIGVVGRGMVHHASVVPNEQIAVRPTVTVRVLGALHVEIKVIEDRLAFA